MLEAAGEEDQPPVRGPVGQRLGGRVVGDPQGHAAGDRHRVEVAVAVVVAHEGERPAVGAEARVLLLARRAGQRRRHAALRGDQPEVVGVEEGDVAGADVGVAQHPGVGLDLGGGGRSGGRGQNCEGEEGRGGSYGHGVSSCGTDGWRGRTGRGPAIVRDSGPGGSRRARRHPRRGERELCRPGDVSQRSMRIPQATTRSTHGAVVTWVVDRPGNFGRRAALVRRTADGG